MKKSDGTDEVLLAEGPLQELWCGHPLRDHCKQGRRGEGDEEGGGGGGMEAADDGEKQQRWWEQQQGEMLHAVLSWVIPSSANVPLQAEKREGKREGGGRVSRSLQLGMPWPNRLRSLCRMPWSGMQKFSHACNVFLPSRTAFAQRSYRHHPRRGPLG